MKKISDFNSATEKYPVVYAGSATRPEYVDMPTVLQQQEGVAPLDTCPAQWWNAMWKLATKDINAFRDYVGDAFTEINNLLTEFGITLDDTDSEQLYKFFHNDYVQNYLKSIFVNKSGDTIDGDLHIKGDLSVDGIGEEVISTELKVGANTITLRNGNPTSLGNTELAGIVTENYDGSNHNNIIAINKDGEARTGDIDIATRILYSNDGTNFYIDEELTTPATIGADEEVRDTGNQTSGGVEIYEGITYSNDDTEPLLTRDEASQLPNGATLVWDATNKRAIAGSTSGISVITTATTTINNIPLSNDSAIKVMFTSDISDSNTPGGTTPLEITYNNVSIPVKANKDGSLVDVFAQEVQANVWKYLQAYTTLEMVYMSNYDGLGNSAFVIVGNPIVLSSADYITYANGQYENLSYSTTEQKTGGYWIDGKPIYRKVITTNARTIYDNWNTVALDVSVHTDYVIKCYMVSTSKNGTGGGVSADIKALVYADGTVHINNQYSNVNNTVYCILEYTKTTD